MNADELREATESARELGEYCLQIMAYIIVPSRWLAAYFIFQGPGGNGKSMLMSLLGRLIGDEHVSTMPVEKFARDNHAEAFLLGKTLWYEDDLKTGFALPDEFFKRFSEGSSVTANPKNRMPFVFENTAALAVCTNTPPALKDVSPGMKRRAHVLPLRRRFALASDLEVLPVDERAYYDTADPNRQAQLLSQREGVLAELVRAYGRVVRAGGLQRPACAQQAVRTFFKDGAPLEAFYDDCCTYLHDAKTKAGDLKRAVDSWAEEQGMGWHPSAGQLKDQLLKIEPRIEHCRRKDGIYFLGLQLRGDRSGIGAVPPSVSADFEAAGLRLGDDGDAGGGPE